jgi:two-component system phosphate regulon response regulator OmpR
MKKILKILVIDDDTRLRNLLGKFLEENGFEATLAKDTDEAKSFLSNQKFDLLIVDVMLPKENGIEFTHNFRLSLNSTPVIMLTARGEQDDRIKGLEVGADDYMPKPFEPKELLLRINNILRRTQNNIYNIVEEKIDNQAHIFFGDFSFNLHQLRLKKLEEFIHITESEAKILKILAENQGNAIARNNLSEMLGGVDERSIDVSITRLRKKIEVNPKQPHYLQTIRNFGYILRK